MFTNKPVSPFDFGAHVVLEEFTNRKEEKERLRQNFFNGVNTILMSPRRWGKSSLVKEVSGILQAESDRYKFVIIDLFSTRTEQQFYELYSSELVAQTAGKTDKALMWIKQHLSALQPSISWGGDMSEWRIGLNIGQVSQTIPQLLDMAEHIAKEQDIRLIVCLDEFQNISHFSDSEAFQKLLRASWQKHKHTTYCLYGSKRGMLSEFFENAAMPFYKFGDVMYLEKIKVSDWISFIIKRFKSTGKKISTKQARLIAETVDCHSFYVQQLAHEVWVVTGDTVKDGVVEQVFDKLLQRNSVVYQRECDGLTNTQLGMLRALLNGETSLYASEVISKYGMGTSANVLRIKQALENREIVDFGFGKPDILDPAFAAWLKRYFFR
jgi:hypothetical protein